MIGEVVLVVALVEEDRVEELREEQARRERLVDVGDDARRRDWDFSSPRGISPRGST
jgi:hypothetical protein